MTGETLKPGSDPGRWPREAGLYFNDAEAKALWNRTMGRKLSPQEAAGLLLKDLPATPVAIVYDSGAGLEIGVTGIRDPQIAPAALREQIRRNPELENDRIKYIKLPSAGLAHDPVNTDYHFLFETSNTQPELVTSVATDVRPSLQGRGIGTTIKRNEIDLFNRAGFRKYGLVADTPDSFLTWAKMPFMPEPWITKALSDAAREDAWVHGRSLEPAQRDLLSNFAKTPSPETLAALMRDKSLHGGQTLGERVIADSRIFNQPADSRQQSGLIAMYFDLTDRRQRRLFDDYRPASGRAGPAPGGPAP